MINRILNKHVIVGFYGVECEGFILSSDDNYFEMVEQDNSIIILKKDDISYVRIAKPVPAIEQVEEHHPTQTCRKFPAIIVKPTQPQAEQKPAPVFTMNNSEGPYQYPTFAKKEEK